MVDQLKLKRAAIYTEWLYVKEPSSSRQQRPLRSEDIELLTTIVKDINVAYQAAKQQHGVGASFQICKDNTLNLHNFDEATRNFFASTLATYFRWQQRRNSDEYLAKATYLDRLAAYREHTDPKHH